MTQRDAPQLELVGSLMLACIELVEMLKVSLPLLTNSC
jgi:hypothetical protein